MFPDSSGPGPTNQIHPRRARARRGATCSQNYTRCPRLVGSDTHFRLAPRTPRVFRESSEQGPTTSSSSASKSKMLSFCEHVCMMALYLANKYLNACSSNCTKLPKLIEPRLNDRSEREAPSPSSSSESVVASCRCRAGLANPCKA